MQIVSIVSISGKNKKYISVCRLLKILPRVLSVNHWQHCPLIVSTDLWKDLNPNPAEPRYTLPLQKV